MASKRTKALSISKEVKDKVWERDRGRCILCHSPQAYPNAHYIPRSSSGLGIEENIITLCPQCHHLLDHTVKRKDLMGYVKSYLDGHYPGFTDQDRRYKK